MRKALKVSLFKRTFLKISVKLILLYVIASFSLCGFMLLQEILK